MTLPINGPTTSTAQGASGVRDLYEHYGSLIGHGYSVAEPGRGSTSGFVNISLSEACATRFEGSAERFDMSENRQGLDLVILSFPEAGQSIHYRQGNRDCTAQPGEAILHTTDKPLHAQGEGTGAVLAMALPRSKLAPLVANKDRLAIGKLEPTPALSLLRSHVRSFVELGTTPQPDLAILIADQLCDLAALTLDASAAGRERAKAGTALSDARFDRAMRYISRHLDRPGLSERDIAAHLILSVSSVRQLFAARHTSPARAIRICRADMAARLLSDPARRNSKVATIAFECGFQSLSAFYEAFRDRHGMHPGDYRGAADKAAD